MPKAFGRCHLSGGGVLQAGAVIGGGAAPAHPGNRPPAVAWTGRLTLALSDCFLHPKPARDGGVG
jgi:hypothetical protein